MAFVIKNARVPRSSLTEGNGQSVVGQWVHVSKGATSLPASTTQNLFQVLGGRIRVHLLMSEVTTVIEGTDPVMKYTSTAKDAAGVTVGTAVDIASTVTIASLEVGGKIVVEGDGTALVKSNAGAAFLGASGEVGPWVAPQGFINIETTATKTGALKHDIWYQPLDEGAYVVAV